MYFVIGQKNKIHLYFAKSQDMEYIRCIYISVTAKKHRMSLERYTYKIYNVVY